LIPLFQGFFLSVCCSVVCSPAYHTLNPNILTSLQAINVSDISELRPGSHALAFVRSGSTANDKEVSAACRLSCTAVSACVLVVRCLYLVC
jgi:hypothetical protein